MEDTTCHPCEETVIQKYPACPLQCMSPKCKAYNRPPIDSDKTPIVWVLGGPGSGKGTLCGKIIAKYGFINLRIDELTQAEIQSGSDRAKCLTTITERGELIPNDLILDLMKAAIVAQSDTAKGFILDGYPSEKAQGIAFEKTIAPVTVIIYLEASRETLTKRMGGPGPADNEEIMRRQIKAYLDNHERLLAQYPDKHHRINADDPIDSVFSQVEQILDPLVAKSNSPS